MLFYNHQNRAFNSIELKYYQARMLPYTDEFAYCLERENELFIIGSCQSLDECKQKAQAFSKEYKVNVCIYHFVKDALGDFSMDFKGDIFTKKKYPAPTVRDKLINNIKTVKVIDVNKRDSTVDLASSKYLETLKKNKEHN